MVTSGSKKFGHINRVAVLSGQASQFHDLRAGMTNTPYIAFAFLEHSLINNRNVDTAYKNRKKLLKIFFHYILLFIYLLKHFKNTAIKSQKVHFMCTVV